MSPMIATTAFGGRLLPVAALLVGLLAGSVAAARNVALLVGVGHFGDPILDKNNQLLGIAADLDAVQKALIEHWQFNSSDILVLRDSGATRDRILAEISALEQRSAPGDTVLIYFGGHGSSANDEDNLFDLPYATGAWVPYDFDPQSPSTQKRTLIIGRTDLVPRLRRLDTAGRWVVVVSDSCFSGQVVRRIGQTHSQSRYLPLHSRDLGVASTNAPAPSARPPPPPYPYQHVVLLSGASDSESAVDISSQTDLEKWPTLDNRFHGAFTDAFLRLLDGQLRLPDGQAMQGSFTYAQGREAMNWFLESRAVPQHPQLLPAIAEDPQDVGSNPFLGATHSPVSTGALTGAAAAPRDVTVHVKLEDVTAPLRASIAAASGVAIVDHDAELTVRESGQQVQLLGPAGDPIVSTVSSDPKLVQRIAAQAWVNRTLPAGSDALGLRAETDPGSRGNTFVQCESFVFEVRLQKAAYLMLLDLDPQGGLTVLYPTRSSERQIVAAGAAKAIPGSDPNQHILVTAPFGMDQVTVLAFERPQEFLAEINGAQRFTVGSGRAEVLARGLAHISGAVSVQQINVNTYAGNGKDSCGP
ncbi:MAG: DUF4384 domain-containing protein [Steroidobacteraceae bacterium]